VKLHDDHDRREGDHDERELPAVDEADNEAGDERRAVLNRQAGLVAERLADALNVTKKIFLFYEYILDSLHKLLE